MEERGKNRRAEIWVVFLFFQLDNTRYKFSGKYLKFKIIIQLALEPHQNIQCYLHKAEEDFVSVVLCERNVYFII